MPRQGKTPDLACAPIQDMKQDALALLHANWLTMPEHLSIDHEGVIADFVTVRHALRQRSRHGRLAGIFQRRNRLRR
jgi:hypothetical protein